MTDSRSFIVQCLEGDAGLDDIDDFVDAWHDHAGDAPLWEFLGMTHDEYGLWVENPEVLAGIVNAHRRNTTVAESVRELAGNARGMHAAEMRRVQQWLKEREARTA